MRPELEKTSVAHGSGGANSKLMEGNTSLWCKACRDTVVGGQVSPELPELPERRGGGAAG